MKEYKNPWHDSRNPVSKEVYKVREDGKIEEYRGYYIVTGVNPWIDVVNSDHYCVSQVGSVRYAKRYIDSLK